MTTNIGYAAIQLIPSLDGFADAVDRQLNGVISQGRSAGRSVGRSLAAGVQSSEADIKRAFDNHAKLADRAADATGKLKVAQAGYQDLVDKGITSGQRFERAKAAVEKTTRDEARATKIATDALKDYERAAKQAESAGKDVGKGFTTGLRSGTLGGASSAGESAGDGFADGFAGAGGLARLAGAGGPIGTALAAAGTIGGKLLGEAVMAQMQTDVGFDLAQAQLGLGTQEMADLALAAGEAYGKNFGESVLANVNTGQAILQAGILTGTDDPALNETIEQLTTVSTLMGEDVTAAARAAGQMIKTGLADNATEAFDIITKGQQNGLNISGDLLDTLNEYGTQFRKLGLDGPEAIGLISQAMAGGARDTDVAADALKEFSIRAIDGSESTSEAFTALGLDADAMATKFAAGGTAAHDAFGQVLAAVASIKDPVEQGRVAAQLFGTQWEDLGQAFNRFDLSKARTEFGEVAGASQRAADQMSSNADNEWELAKRNIIGKVQEIKDALNFGEWFSEIPKQINDMFEDTPALQPGAPGVQPALTVTAGPAVAPPAPLPPNRNPLDVIMGRRAYGGPINGPGGPKSDIIPIWASNGEHVWTAEEVAAVGGHDKVRGLRDAALSGAFGRYAEGGAIGPDVAAAKALAGTPYSQSGRTDCSGMAARVINRALGLPETGLMSTKNAEEWLAARGFVPGRGGPGQISVGWYDHGPNPNDGHMAMTLSDGTNAEAGGSNDVFTLGAGAAGADSPQFDRHMHLPTLYGEGPAGSASSPFAGGSAVAAAGSPPLPPSNGGGSSSSGGGTVSVPSSLTGLSRALLDSLGAGVGTTGSGSDLSEFGQAAGAAVSGQVGSALGVLGVNDSPGWLQGLSQFVGGLSISDNAGNSLFEGGNLFGDGGGAAPLSAQSFGSGVAPPDDVHGTRAGQAPGPPVTNWTINARDTEDAFVKAQRLERERAAARLARY